MATFGAIGPFDETIESWSLYACRLEQFFLANDVKDNGKKRVILLTVIGPSTFKLLHTLVSPASPAESSFDQLVATLSQHFSPIPSEIVERYKFNTRIRKSNETISCFISALRGLAQHCNYGSTLDTMLRDRIVCGIQNQQIQTRLLAETNLNLERAMQIALAMETATRDAMNLQLSGNESNHNPLAQINKLHTESNHKGNYRNKNVEHRFSTTAGKNLGKNKGNNSQTKTTAHKKCIRCGNCTHTPPQCPYKDVECYTCGKIGHLSSQCLTRTEHKKGTVKPKLQRMNEIQTDANIAKLQSTKSEYCMFQVKNIVEEPPRPTQVVLQVNDYSLTMELDTGAAFSVISESTYKSMPKLPPLQSVDMKLKSFTGHTIEVLGGITVHVKTPHGCQHDLTLLVVKGEVTSLCGRNWITPLNLVEQKVHNMQKANSVQNILEKHKNVFVNELGKLKSVKVQLSIKKDAVPKFCKARSVPFALREQVNNEIERLTEAGILEPVRHAEWAAPVVPVLKADKSSIRLCGDFKQTINPVACVEKYPLPRAEDIYAKLAGGKKFSKIDLREAYNQLELDEESRNLVVINTQKGLYRYTRLPYGVSSASAIFQRESDILVQGLDMVSAYQDDILVTGRDDDDHLKNLDETLTRIEDAGLKVKLEKCSFFNDSVVFLGNRLDKNGLHPEVSKVKSIKEAPAPENLQQLRSFLGMLSYYRKFLPNLSSVLAPLHELLRHNIQ